MTTEVAKALSEHLWVWDLPEAQHTALIRLYGRHSSKMTLNDFLSRCSPPAGMFKPYVGFVDDTNMFIGIEPDGHTHT